MHTGQRDMIRIRVSKDTYQAGFRLKHIGEVLYARVKSEFAAVVDKCQVTIITDPAQCTELRHNLAIPMFDKRDERLTTLTDEGVDVYYSCIMCQAFSPSHVCVVTPERLGASGPVRSRILAGRKGDQRAGSPGTLPGDHQGARHRRADRRV